MAAKRIMITLIILVLVSLACESVVSKPDRESQETQAGELPGCEFLPADVPFLQEQLETEQFQGWCAYQTSKEYASAVIFYKEQLTANGWKEFRTIKYEGELGSTTYFYWEKSGRKLSVGILFMSGLGAKDVLVSLYPDHWINQPCNSTVNLPTPEDVPLVENMIGLCLEEYPSAGGGYYHYQYTTLENFETVEQFYRTETIKSGWTLDRDSKQGVTLELVFKKPGRIATILTGEKKLVEAPLETMRIQITTAEEYGDTDVTIQIDNVP